MNRVAADLFLCELSHDIISIHLIYVLLKLEDIKVFNLSGIVLFDVFRIYLFFILLKGFLIQIISWRQTCDAVF